jgi:hypothetical protein
MRREAGAAALATGGATFANTRALVKKLCAFAAIGVMLRRLVERI